MKKLFLFWLLLGIGYASHAQTVTTTVTPTTICPDTLSPVTVNYSVTGATLSQNTTFFIELSDMNGSFANPTNIRWFNSASPSGVQYIPIPNSVTPGTGYRIRTVVYSPNITGTDNGTDLTILQAPPVAQPSYLQVCTGNSIVLTSIFTAGATYSWTGPNGFNSTDPNPVITNATPANSGFYYLEVTLNGCTSNTLYNVSVSSNPIPIYANSNQPVCPGQVLTLFAWGNFNDFSWTGPNGFAGTGSTIDIVNLQPSDYGTYTVSGINGGTACPSTATVEVGPPAAPFVYTQNPDVCPGASIYLYGDSSSFTSTYSWVGPNGFTSNQAFPVIPNATSANSGTYSLFIDYGTCVSPPGTVQVNVSPSLNVTATNNGPVDQGNTLILTAGGSQGNYQWTGPNGFTASGTNPYINNAAPTHSGNYTVSLTSPGCTPATAITTVLVNEMNLVSGTVYNDANNNGTQDTGENGLGNMMLGFQPGNYVASTDNSGNYTAYLPAGSFTATVINLAANQTASPGSHAISFTGTGNASSNNDFGVHSTPVNDVRITLTEVWNTSPGFTTYIKITAKNLGSNPASGTIRFLPDPILTMNTTTTGGYTMAGDTVVWNYSNLQPNAQTFRYVYMTVPASTALGTAVTTSAVITPVAGDINPINNYFTLNQTVIGSWDPNDKQVQPAGDITPTQVASGQELIYKVRFQNTGTAPAVNIMILDTLSDNLDLSTFQMLSASHSYDLNLKNPGVLEWKFNNIMLPDSNTNEPESHGYVQYSIKPLSTLTIGDQIENTAHIYFDFNEAIITNTTVTAVGLVSAPEGLNAGTSLQLYPNPNNGNFTVKLSNSEAGKVQIRVLNMLGQEVYTEAASTENSAFERQINMGGMAAGVYLLHVQQGDNVYTKRMVVQK